MNKFGTSLAVSLVIVAFILGLAGGYFLSPTYQQTMYVKESMGLGQADKFIDLRYINQMAAHHRAAILLANQAASKSTRDEIKSLALDIQTNEPKLIDELYAWKARWYQDNRKVSDPAVASLGETGKNFDLRFLNALIAHHEAGIEMTREIRFKSSRSEILDNADAVENFLSKSLVTLRGWRAEWFKVE